MEILSAAYMIVNLAASASVLLLSTALLTEFYSGRRKKNRKE